MLRRRKSIHTHVAMVADGDAASRSKRQDRMVSSEIPDAATLATSGTTRRPLRRDLLSTSVESGLGRYRLVSDEISGRFSRVAEHLWLRLNRGEADSHAWAQAAAAGWTQERARSAGPSFSPFYIRIPIAPVDAPARVLARYTDAVFSHVAVLFWSGVIVAAAIVLLTRMDDVAETLGTFRSFLDQVDPVWLGTSFLVTKLLHESAHAVVCRRMGARCGRFGILILCGFPCPYCDVTDVWRQPSRLRRAAVMASGIYVELILAAMAVFVWANVADPTMRFAAFNVVLLCGVSTLLFNANPLMRYDGYYILGDLLDSVNLRAEAARAYRGTVTRRLGGSRHPAAKRCDFRAMLLSVFHSASALYRIAVGVMLGTALIIASNLLHLRSLATVLVAALAVVMCSRHLGRLIKMTLGAGEWRYVPWARRGMLSAALIAGVMILLLLPTPRFRHADGWLDAPDARNVYCTGGGLVQQVGADFGDHVGAGQMLVQLSDSELEIETVRLEGQLRLAELRSQWARRAALDRPETSDQWPALQAAEDAIAASLATAKRRAVQNKVVSPTAGFVMPGTPTDPNATSADPAADPQAASRPAPHRGDVDAAELAVRNHPLTDLRSLTSRVGRSASASPLWCRISPSGRLAAVLTLDASDRREIDLGTPVSISFAQKPGWTIHSRIVSVSTIEPDADSVLRRAQYRVLCELPGWPDDERLALLGSRCAGVFHLPARTLAADLCEWIGDWVHE